MVGVGGASWGKRAGTKIRSLDFSNKMAGLGSVVGNGSGGCGAGLGLGSTVDGQKSLFLPRLLGFLKDNIVDFIFVHKAL